METLLFLLTLWLISGQCYQDIIRVTGQLGSSLTFPCRYPKTYTDYAKSICILTSESCRSLVSLDGKSTEAREGRYSLAYNREERTLNVTIDGLLESDRAMYRCTARTGINEDKTVITVVLYVIGHRVRSVDLRCPYDVGLERSSKYLYRGACSTNASVQQKNILIQSNQSNILVTRGRFSLFDNTADRVLTVTITDLTAEDSGKYCCVFQRLTDIYIQHLLFFYDNLTDWMTSTGDPVHMPMPMTVPLVAVAVVMALLFVGLIVFIWRRTTYNGSSSLLANRKCGDLSVETLSHPDGTSGDTTVYAVATFPQSTSEGLYSLAQFPRPDSDNHVYSCLELPQNTSSNLGHSEA